MKSEADRMQHRKQKAKWRASKAAKVASARIEQAKHSHNGLAFANADDAHIVNRVANQLMQQFGISE